MEINYVERDIDLNYMRKNVSGTETYTTYNEGINILRSLCSLPSSVPTFTLILDTLARMSMCVTDPEFYTALYMVYQNTKHFLPEHTRVPIFSTYGKKVSHVRTAGTPHTDAMPVVAMLLGRSFSVDAPTPFSIVESANEALASESMRKYFPPGTVVGLRHMSFNDNVYLLDLLKILQNPSTDSLEHIHLQLGYRDYIPSIIVPEVDLKGHVPNLKNVSFNDINGTGRAGRADLVRPLVDAMSDGGQIEMQVVSPHINLHAYLTRIGMENLDRHKVIVHSSEHRAWSSSEDNPFDLDAAHELVGSSLRILCEGAFYNYSSRSEDSPFGGVHVEIKMPIRFLRLGVLHVIQVLASGPLRGPLEYDYRFLTSDGFYKPEEYFERRETWRQTSIQDPPRSQPGS